MKSYSNETLHVGIDIHAPVSVERFQHLLPEEHLGFALVRLLLVVVQGAAGRSARTDVRYHFREASRASSRISMLRAFSSRVRCSSAAI